MNPASSSIPGLKIIRYIQRKCPLIYYKAQTLILRSIQPASSSCRRCEAVTAFWRANQR